MAFGQGFSGGFGDVVEAPAPSGTRRRARYRLERRTAPSPPLPPPKPAPVRIPVAVHGTWSTAARVTDIDTWVTIPMTPPRTSAKVVGPPLVVALHDLDRRSREAKELAEIGLMLKAVEAWW